MTRGATGFFGSVWRVPGMMSEFWITAYDSTQGKLVGRVVAPGHAPFLDWGDTYPLTIEALKRDWVCVGCILWRDPDSVGEG